MFFSLKRMILWNSLMCLAGRWSSHCRTSFYHLDFPIETEGFLQFSLNLFLKITFQLYIYIGISLFRRGYKQHILTMSRAEPWMEREAIAAGGSNSYILTDIGEVGRGEGWRHKKSGWDLGHVWETK